MNIYLMKGDYNTRFGRLRIPDAVAAGPVFKELLRYEIEEELDFEEATYCAMIHYSFGKSFPYKMDDFHALTDRDFVTMMRDSLEYFGGNPSIDLDDDLYDVERRPCANCAVVEEEVGNHKMCGFCKVVPYCSRACQKGHWAVHKGACKGKRKK